MIDIQFYSLIGLGLYFGALILIGILAARNESQEGFIIGGRNVGIIPTAASIVGGFRDGSGLVFWVSAGFGLAYGGWWIFVGFLVSLAFFWRFGRKVRKLSAQQNFITIGEFVRYFGGPMTEKMVGVLIVIFGIILVALQLHVAGNIFSKIMGFEAWIGIILIALVTSFYMFSGGYGTVIKTDLFQFVFIALLLIFPFFIQPSSAQIMDFSSIWTTDWQTKFGLFILGVLYIPSSADVWQRVFSARNDKVLKTSFPLGGIALFIITTALIWMGMGIKLVNSETDPSNALFSLFETGGTYLNPLMLGLLAVVCMAVAMSTLDTYCYSAASSFIKNLLPLNQSDSREKYVRLSRLFIMGCMSFCVFVAMNIGDVVDFIFSIVPLLYILTPIYIICGLGLCRKGPFTDRVLTAAIIIGAAVFFGMIWAIGFDDLSLMGIPAAASTLTILVFYKRIFTKAAK